MDLETLTRDLSRGMSGADVGSLQTSLIQIGYRIADKELTDKFFGDTTLDAVVDFQKKVKLVPNGIFDGKAAWLIDDDREHPNKFIVIGQVVQANGAAMEGLTVKAFDKDLRSEQQLIKTDTTKKSGEYAIFYRADEFVRAEKDRADLFVRVFGDNGATLLATSGIIFNADKVEVVNFTIGDARGLSEFEKIVNEITPVLDGVAQADLTENDIAFLHGETGIDATLLGLLVESARRNNEATTVAQSAFYGLFRQNLPTDLEELLQQEIALLRAALEVSSNDSIIPPLTAAQLDQIADALRILKASLILQPGAPGETSSLGDLLKTTQLTVDKQRIVADLQVQHGGSTDAFWQALNARADFTQTEKNDVRFTLQVGDLTTNHIPLVLELRKSAPAGLIVEPTQKSAVAPTSLSEDATALRPFVVKDVADWKATLLKPQANGQPIGAPPTIPGATLQEKIDNYAIALNRHMEKVLPTPVIAARADKDTASDNPFATVKTDMRTFFLNNPLYEFRKTPIDTYLSDGRDQKLIGVVNPVALLAELKNMQRLFNLTPRYAEIRSLRKDDVHSALSIVKLGQRRFTEKYATSLGGEDKAIDAYRKAQQTHATALTLYLNHALSSNLPSPSVVPSTSVNGNGTAGVKTLATTTSATPDLPTLFGSLDLCDCDECQSLYSPAAYFVDILRFLGDGPLNSNGETPLQVLLTRRPDLEHIGLTCENTTTQLPYVDLTREILERTIVKREFAIAEGSDISSVLADLDLEKIPTSFVAAFPAKGYPLATNASVRKDEVVAGQPRAWLILDTGWSFRVVYLGTSQGFKVEAWPQTSWTAEELRANPEHVHGAAYAVLRPAVYPWNLPLNLPVEETRVYLGQFGMKRAEVMETFFRGTPVAALSDKAIANEYIGLTKEEADIVTGVTTGAPIGTTPTLGAWNFYGLKETGNDLEDPTDGTAPRAQGDWDAVLKRVSIFLQQSGLTYRQMLEVMGSYFVNPAAGSGRMLGIVSTDTSDPTTCNLSKLEIRVVDPQIPDANKRAALIAAFVRLHRFARLSRKVGWSMRDLDRAIVALQPMNASGKLDLTADFLVQLSHVERLAAQLNLPVVNLLSFWASIDTGRYVDPYAEGQPVIPSLYAQLFNNKSAAGQSLAEDPAALTGKLSENTSIIAAALQVNIDNLNLLLADANVIQGDTLNLVNLSRLYRHATFAKALNYSIRNYLSALKLISATPFATTVDTIRFTQQSEKIVASGFSIEDLDYLLRHDFLPTSPLAISDEAIAGILTSIREAVQKVTSPISEDIVVQRIGEYLHLDPTAANSMLTTWINSPANSTQKAIAEFLAPAFVESDPDVAITRAAFPAQFNTFLLVYKIAVLTLKFGLKSEQIQWLFDFGPANGWLDLNMLPLSTTAAGQPFYAGWSRLADLFQLSDALPSGETLLTEIFTSARDATTQIDALLDKISKGTGWKLTNLKALSAASGFNFPVSAYKDEAALRRLNTAFAMLNQLGASADQCLAWTKSGMNETDERKCAQDVKSLVRAKLDAAQWLEIARTLNDPLRDRQRAALVSYLMQKTGARNADELYDDFLVDVEMSPCMMTTRIKQAISSVQLFMQRSLMNLESAVSMTPKEAQEWAQWRKQYRMWEANRKILLYPENWIEPELRDGKSSFFETLENELLQSDVTMDTAETAFLHYLDKLQEVARLEIVGMYRELDATASPAIDVLHVIGRTFSDPHAYYYRRQIDSAYWTPWEKVETDIQGNHLIPLVWNRRLYVFWPIFNLKQEEKTNTPATGTTIDDVKRMLEIQLAWSEYKNGKWSPKKLGTSFLSQLKHPDMKVGEIDYKRFSFKSRVQTTSTGDKQLFIDCYGPVEVVTTTTVSSNGTPPPAQEKYLFSLNAGATKALIATVNGGAFQSSDVSKLDIVARKFDTGVELSRTPLSSDGSLNIRNSTTSAVKYYVSSSTYQAQNIVLTGQKQICWIVGETLPQVVGSNGDSATSAFIESDTQTVETEPILSPALVSTDTTIAPALTSITSGTRVCDIISEAQCEFDLVPLQTTSGTSTTVTTSSITPMQAITSFYFDDGQQGVAPLLGSNAITNLDPIVGTRFENMMMVEYQNSSDGLGEPKILQATPGTFRLLGMHQSYVPKTFDKPIFFQDDNRTYFVVDVNNATQVRFNTFFHPTVRSFVKSLNNRGISGLLTLPNQLLIDQTPAFDAYNADSTKVDLSANAKPRENVDFSYGGAYSIYNWELFFHAPFMIATQLSKNQRFEEAQKWFHYIFDPTATDSPLQPANPGPERFWRVKPLYDQARQGTTSLADLFKDDDALAAQVNQWQANPFNPHVIARLRLVTYMKAVVMRYIDNLIAWGDQLFRRDTIESVNEATQLYILAAQILGRRPEQIPVRAKAKTQTFRTLDDSEALNSLANAAVEIEGFLSPSLAPVTDADGDGGVPMMPFFGIPGNEKLLGYWATVADRLFKIRHCLNIEGVVRSLPTFEPPIDPGLLAKAAIAGVDVGSAISDINVALPHYRFNVVLQKASELCGEVKSLGGALLSALEKRDAEALALLRSTHEMKVLRAMRTVKEKQLAEAKIAREQLDRSKELTTIRRDYYRDIAFMNAGETAQVELTAAGLYLQVFEAETLALAGALSLVPNFKLAAPTSTGFTSGGDNFGQSVSNFSNSVGKVVGLLNTTASLAGMMGGHQRRFDDWKLQERLANKELEQIEKQIAAADIRMAIAEKELSNHDLQIENTTAVDEFMRSKFTNRELYDWMVGQISGIYFQSYQLAYDVAKRAERAYRYELGVTASSFIQFGYWDSLKKGLLAGERLSYDLKRMEVQYMEQNMREYEIVKHVSLLSIDPVSLVKLKQTGECFVSLPEALFDVDYPGHYMRRMKSVGITVPCVAGPYSGINCTLTLQNSTIRIDNALANGKYARQNDDSRFADSEGTAQSIVTSSAQNDSGMFETNLNDQRYLPFEGQGAISSWRIELPKNFKTFDYNTISDVVLHVRYTSRDGGTVLKGQAEQELQAALNDFIRVEGQRGLTQMFSLRHEFSTEWARFLSPSAGAVNSLTMPINMERFPFLFQGKNITIGTLELLVKMKPGFTGSMNITLAAGSSAPAPPNAQPSDILALTAWNGLLRGTKGVNSAPGAFTMNAWSNQTLDANAIQDIMVVCRYTCS